MTAFAIVSTLVCATWTDYTKQRWPVLIYMSIALIISSICILVWSSPTGLKFFAYCESGFLCEAMYHWDVYPAPFRSRRGIILGTSNNICVSLCWFTSLNLNSLCNLSDGPTKLAQMIIKKEQWFSHLWSTSNCLTMRRFCLNLWAYSMWNNVINAWWPLLFYSATDAPRFQKGMIAMICTCFATLCCTGVVWWLERREWRQIRESNDGSDGAFEEEKDVDEKD